MGVETFWSCVGCLVGWPRIAGAFRDGGVGLGRAGPGRADVAMHSTQHNRLHDISSNCQIECRMRVALSPWRSVSNQVDGKQYISVSKFGSVYFARPCQAGTAQLNRSP